MSSARHSNCNMKTGLTIRCEVFLATSNGQYCTARCCSTTPNRVAFPSESHRLEDGRSVGTGRLALHPHPCAAGETMVVGPKFLAWVLRSSVCRLSALA